MPGRIVMFAFSFRQWAFLALMTFCMAVPRESQASWVVGAGTGINLCLPDGAADCRGYLPHVNLDLSLGYRFKYLSLTLDYDLGWLSAGGDDLTIQSTHLMPVLRLLYPYAEVEWVAGIGVGYGSMSGYDGKAEEEFFSWLKRLSKTISLLIFVVNLYRVLFGT